MAEQDPAAMPYHSGGGLVSPILRGPETQDFNHQEYGMCNLRACIASLIPIHSSQQLVIDGDQGTVFSRYNKICRWLRCEVNAGQANQRLFDAPPWCDALCVFMYIYIYLSQASWNPSPPVQTSVEEQSSSRCFQRVAFV